MTLHTRVYALTPVSAKETFDYCRTMLGAATDTTWERRDSYYEDGSLMFRNLPMQGLPAWLDVHYRSEEPLRPTDSEGQSATFLEVGFDTAYGYTGPNGEGCGDLHARLVSMLGGWFDARDVDWSWENEFTGDVYHRYDGLDTIGDADRVAEVNHV